jgi:hypothetical protein
MEDLIPLHGDNKGAVDLVLNPVTRRRPKHIPIKFHVIHGYIEDGFITLIQTPTSDMLADGLTKPLICCSTGCTCIPTRAEETEWSGCQRQRESEEFHSQTRSEQKHQECTK